MSENLQEINAVVDRHDFIDKEMAEYAIGLWIEQFLLCIRATIRVCPGVCFLLCCGWGLAELDF